MMSCGRKDLFIADFLSFVFLPQRVPLAPLWPLRAPARTTPSSTYYLPAEGFFVFQPFLKEPSFLFFFFLCTFLFFSLYRSTFRRVERLSQAKYNTAQHSAITPAQSSKTKVRADQSATTQASRQSWREPRASMSSSFFVQLACVFKTNASSRNLPGLPKMYTIEPLTPKESSLL